MISDRALVLAAKAAYGTGTPVIEALAHAVRIFRVDVDGLPVYSVEGTHDELGWALDFFAARALDHETVDHPSLGFLHAGFLLAAMAVLPRLALLLQGVSDYALTGHSLGAELALLLGGLLIDDGRPPVKIGAFAPPRGGGERFVGVVTSVPFCAYRFGRDPVPTVPLTLLGFPYRQVPLTQLEPTAASTEKSNAISTLMGWLDERRMFADHHIDHYVDAIQE